MKPNLINFLASTAVGSVFIFLPLMAKELGATDFSIGLIVSAYGATNLLSLFIFGRLSDTIGRKIFIMMGLGLSAMAFLAHVFANSVLSLFIIRAIAGFSVGVYPAALTAYVWETRKRLGKFTSYSSLGWAAGTLMAGIVASYNGIFLLASVSFLVSFIISLKLPFVRELHHKVPIFPKEVIRQNLSIYLPFFLRHVGAQMVWTIFPLYLWGMGATKLWIGLINFVNPSVQFFVMRFAEKRPEKLLVEVGMLSSVLAFFLFAIATHYYHTIFIMIVVAVSWSCLYMGSVTHLARTNVEKATAVGILNSTAGLCAMIGPLLGGLVSHFYGFRAVMLVAAFMGAAGFGAVRVAGNNRPVPTNYRR